MLYPRGLGREESICTSQKWACLLDSLQSVFRVELCAGRAIEKSFNLLGAKEEDTTGGVWGYLGGKANRSRGAQSNLSMMEKPGACLGALLCLHSNILVVSVFIS